MFKYILIALVSVFLWVNVVFAAAHVSAVPRPDDPPPPKNLRIGD